MLVTRPEPGASEALERVDALGWRGLAAPSLTVQPLAPLAPFENCSALLLTSAQALPALSRQPKERLLLAVGSATARRARAAGFENIRVAGGTAETLEALCRAEGLEGPEVILACGRGQDGRLYGGELAAALKARQVEAYRVARASSLPLDAVKALQTESVDAVLFYSSETVRAFLALCGLETRAVLKRVRAVCLSENIASRLERNDWREIIIGAPLEALGPCER